jgi:general secretion pathway protein L
MMGQMMGATRLPALTGRGAKRVMAWTAVAAAVAIIGMNLYWLKLESETKAIRGQMETSFRSNFPEATAVVDPIVQTKRQLSDLRARVGIPSANDFSVLNARTALLLSAAPVGSVAGMDYRDGALKVKFKPGVVENPALQNALRSAAVSRDSAIRFEADGSARISGAGS